MGAPARDRPAPVEVLETGDLERAVDALYALPAEQFVAAREQLVKRLKAAKRKDDAASVHALARPSAAAWALDEVARRDPARVDALVEAGRVLVEAQRASLTGGDADALRAAVAERDRLVRAMASAAATVLDERGGNGAGAADALRGTLEAVALLPDVSAALRRGRITRTVDPPSGFELLAALDVPVRPSTPESPAPRPDEAADRERADAREREREREREEAARRAALADAEERARRATVELDRATRAVERLTEEVDRLEAHLVERRGALEEAQRAAARARQDNDAAVDATARARAAFDEPH